MKRTTILLGVALVGLLALSGLAAATSSTTAPVDAQAPNQTTDDQPGYGSQVNATDVDRALDGSNSPFVTGDERLEVFQDRFDLTDAQVERIQTEVTSMVDDDATQEDIRATVTDMLESYGVEDSTLGPPVDGSEYAEEVGQQAGYGQNSDSAPDQRGGWGAGDAGQRGVTDGSGVGSGPHGPGDGSCLQ